MYTRPSSLFLSYDNRFVWQNMNQLLYLPTHEHTKARAHTPNHERIKHLLICLHCWVACGERWHRDSLKIFICTILCESEWMVKCEYLTQMRTHLLPPASAYIRIHCKLHPNTCYYLMCAHIYLKCIKQLTTMIMCALLRIVEKNHFFLPFFSPYFQCTFHYFNPYNTLNESGVHHIAYTIVWIAYPGEKCKI